jgi:putative ABC transport system permease protein
MLINYLKTAFRGFLKNPLSSFINTLGLAMAVGCCIVVYAYLNIEFRMEEQHANADRIFMITSEVNRDGAADLFGWTPQAMKTQLEADFPQIKYAARVEDRGVVIKRDENVFREWTRMVDPDFVRMLDFDVVAGSINTIDKRDHVILNTVIAKKYFGDEDPIGQTLLMKFPEGKATMTVGAVIDVQETKTSMLFDFLTNYELLEIVDPAYQSVIWAENISGTFIMTEEPEDIKAIAAGITTYPDIVNSAQTDWEVVSYGFEPLNTLFDRSAYIRSDISRNSDSEGQMILPIIALLMLILACLNYLNLSISSSVKRLKEIGVRKVIGASRSRLIFQFLVENVLLTFIAIVMGTVIGGAFFLPGLNNLFGTEMNLEILEWQFYVFALILMLFTALLSGAYPAMYVSRFQIVSILKGKLQFGRRNVLSKVFMTLQFVIATIAIVCGVFFYLNTDYQYDRNWGYNKSATLLIPTQDNEMLETFRNRLNELPEIQATSAGAHHLGWRVSSSVIDLTDRKMEVRQMDVEPGYLSTMELALSAGRDFKKDFASDAQVVLVNETFVRNMEWEDPIFQTFKFDSLNYTVVGVLEDFHYYSYWNDIEPLFMRVGDPGSYNLLAVKANEGDIITTYESIESLWLEVFPEEPFRGRYQSDMFTNYYRSINGHKYLMGTVALIAMLMTCLGLYGLVGINVASRVREFSVRKVLGANVLAMSKAVGSHFMWILLVALLVAAPVSYWVVQQFFDTIYTYHMPMTFLPVLFAMFLIIATILLTLTSHLLRVVKSNPVEGLRVE